MLLRNAAIAAGRLPPGTWPDQRALLAALAEAVPLLAPCSEAVPSSGNGPRPPSQPHRYSGRTAVAAHRDVREPAPPSHPESPFATTMEGWGGTASPLNWAPGWNSGQAVLRHQAMMDGPVADAIAGVLLFAERRGQPRWLPVRPARSTTSGLWLLPRARVFGTDELSNCAPAVIARSGQAVVALHPHDAALLGLTEGTMVECGTEGTSLRRRVELDDRLPTGVVAVDFGFPGDAFAALPGIGTIRVAAEDRV
jgi:NADH-quinone oxidoreductase subunit G